ncbi:CCA-adding tRNA nucleotidyltransferase [Candidatus Kinetoplastibacterium desouzaii TCC079E]|uniref:CCA-adding tRNA nucleotidyltransferase n=1 Tax=Candidatus Kinetoplastidibacterium desouzai TCC079E TaxID=1208919 RepID=M1M4W6_9PROT|nr:CCA-adding tRNA nucleotidyltransferase [Candidatus Kinetoplastibacterium desouzaii]AGF47225.1 CCA-adding tRNA nucleotidyltransferase [Candidatus Kinetoplastibacterium desouzaii TCC079E]
MITEDKYTKGLEFYMVGGAVRDKLLSIAAGDIDWVVVGSDSLEMQARGFKKVGKDFPVFLHPVSKEEFALARRERKIDVGHKGFECYSEKDVTLLEDLSRRDLTINAIACSNDGKIIDPFNGLKDLKMGVLRHISDSFREDPLRLIRLARFSAKFSRFTIAKETFNICYAIAHTDELRHLSKERVWKEISLGLMTNRPINMFDFLEKTGALSILMPELVLSDRVISFLTNLPNKFNLYVRYALLCIDTCSRDMLSVNLRVESECRNYANLLSNIMDCISVNSLIDNYILLEKCDAFRRPKRFHDLLEAANFLGVKNTNEIWLRLQNVLNIDMHKIIKSNKEIDDIKNLVRNTRLSVFVNKLNK